MPKAKLILEFKDAKDRYEILKGREKFKNSKISIGVKGNRLIFDIEAENAKSMVGTVGSIMKQIRIIDEVSEAVGKA